MGSKRFLGYGRQFIDDSDKTAVMAVLDGDFLTQGPVVEKFESALAQRVGAKHAVAVSSGTAGLHLACLASGMTSGDIGVTTSLTFVASANAFLYAGGRALLSDIDAQTLCLSEDTLSRAISGLGTRTLKVVTPVHFAGLSTGLAAIRKRVGPRVVIIEDACHALGGSDEDGWPVGGCPHSDMSVFSFHPVKPITTGEGGAITTNNTDIYDALIRLRSHGIEKNPDMLQCRDQGIGVSGAVLPWYYEQQMLGYNYRMSDIQAALGLSQLARLDSFLSRRREIAMFYDQKLLHFDHVSTVHSAPDMRKRSGMHLYVIHCDYKALSKPREQVMAELRERGIGSQVHYIPVHRQPFHRNREKWCPADFPVCEDHYKGTLSIPLFSSMSDEDVERVICALDEVLNS